MPVCTAVRSGQIIDEVGEIRFADGGGGLYSEWGKEAWFGLGMAHGAWVWIAFLVFALVAAWFDIRERRIPNWLNLIGLVFFLVWHVGSGSGEAAVFAFVCTGLLLLIPTLLGLWGQGDWKMAMVCGAALGVLPTLFIWWMALLLAKIYSTAAKKHRVRWTKICANAGLPVAVFVLVAAISFFAVIFIF
ncbi:A24 family peptidase [Ferroacidibacillus organovorans]|uniref:A24 family peptidase n=1 Tax=Ferroacidibacillus organovorans TaxID=1765683 RepID=UPI0015C466B2|nr:A24 family peptidase [Ferroacidibacillus organovorans]